MHFLLRNEQVVYYFHASNSCGWLEESSQFLNPILQSVVWALSRLSPFISLQCDKYSFTRLQLSEWQKEKPPMRLVHTERWFYNSTPETRETRYLFYSFLLSISTINFPFPEPPCCISAGRYWLQNRLITESSLHSGLKCSWLPALSIQETKWD